MSKEKVVFNHQYDRKVLPKHFHAPTGEKVEIRHSPHMDSNGRRFLVKDKAVAIYDLIQSHKEECEIENIIRRAIEGDFSILQARHGQYMDITGCPSSIAEAQQFIMDTKDEFEKLPKEIKAKFEFNPEIYIAEMSNNIDSWLEKTGLADKYAAQKAAEEQKAVNEENYQKAIANLAQGTVVQNTEVKTNE